MRRKRPAVYLLPLAMLACGVSLLPHASAAELPAGKGRDTFNTACTSCHDADVSTQQRHTRAGWEKIVQSMKDLGASATPAQFGEIVGYLTEHFGEKPGAPGAASKNAASSEKPVVRRKLPWEKNSLRVGQALYRENCVVCHDIDGLPGKKLGPSLKGFIKDSVPMTNARPSRGYVTGKIRAGGRVMPSFAAKLSGSEINTMLDYMQTK